MSDYLLEIDRLCIAVNMSGTLVPVVTDVSLSLHAGQTLGIVGESGCGKSLTALGIMGLLEGTQVRVTGGTIRFKGRDLLPLSKRERRAMLGREMAMIFQEPMTSLNPVYTIGDQINEMLQQHNRMSRRVASQRATQLLAQVRIPDPADQLRNYPHQLSGGMRQRVMIAMALACNPSLLLADEPTTALDVTVQAQILELLIDLQKQNGMAIVLISHDLGVVAQTCQHVAVMYRGQIAESASILGLFDHPRHPYTQALMQAIPDPDHVQDELAAISGRVPTIDERIDGCSFHPRCHHADERCQTMKPDLVQLTSEQSARCHYPLPVDA